MGTTHRVLFSLLVVAVAPAMGGMVYHMPYYDVEVSGVPSQSSCGNTDYVTLRCDPGDTQSSKNSSITMTWLYTALPGYILTSMEAFGSIGQWAGAVGGWSDDITISLNGTLSTVHDQNVVYWQQGNMDLTAGPLSLLPTTTASITVTYQMATYGTGEVKGNAALAVVHADLGSVPTPEPATTIPVAAGVLALLAKIRRASAG